MSSRIKDVSGRADAGWVDHAARIGLIAYGAVHLLIGWLAIQMALGQDQGKASGQGALAELSQQPLGGVLVWLVAIGLCLLVIWRLIDAAVDHHGDDGADRDGNHHNWGRRAVALFKAALYAALAFAALKVATGSSGSGGDGTQTLTARLLGMPGGQVLVAVVALAVIGYAARLAWRGWTEEYMEHLDSGGQGGGGGTAYRILGKVGHLAKAAALAVVGILIAHAAVTHEAGKSGGLDQALREVLQQPFGPVLLGLIALGIGCYGLFCFARARHFDD